MGTCVRVRRVKALAQRTLPSGVFLRAEFYDLPPRADALKQPCGGVFVFVGENEAREAAQRIRKGGWSARVYERRMRAGGIVTYMWVVVVRRKSDSGGSRGRSSRS